MSPIQREVNGVLGGFSRTYDPPADTILTKHGDSFASFGFGLYRLLRLNRRHRRAIGRKPRRTRTRPGWSHVINESIDGSVFDKWRKEETYRPQNLSDWAAATRESPSAKIGPVFLAE